MRLDLLQICVCKLKRLFTTVLPFAATNMGGRFYRDKIKSAATNVRLSFPKLQNYSQTAAVAICKSKTLSSRSARLRRCNKNRNVLLTCPFEMPIFTDATTEVYSLVPTKCTAAAVAATTKYVCPVYEVCIFSRNHRPAAPKRALCRDTYP